MIPETHKRGSEGRTKMIAFEDFYRRTATKDGVVDAWFKAGVFGADAERRQVRIKESDSHGILVQYSDDSYAYLPWGNIQQITKTGSPLPGPTTESEKKSEC